MRSVHDIDHALEAGGYPRAFLVTQRSAGETDSERKRSLHKKRGHLGQAIERSRSPFLCVTVYEKPPGGVLHSHSLVYGARATLAPVLARLGHLDTKPKARERELGVDTHIRPAVPSDVGYITKARRPNSPEFERTVSHRYVRNERVPGRMLSISEAVKTLLCDMPPLEARRAVEREPTPPPAYVEPSPQLVALVKAKAPPPPLTIVEAAGGQLAFDLGEPVNLAAEAEKRRRALGMSQEAAAARLGISRPTFANAAAGRYRLSPWALSRAQDFLAA